MIEILGFGVRYIVNDVDAAIDFYTKHFGFSIQMHPNSHFAVVSREGLRLMLSTPDGPGGGAQPAKDGRRPEPGGWSRIQLQVKDFAKEVGALREAGVTFRTDMITGIGARQILVADPSGNLIELHELLPRPGTGS